MALKKPYRTILKILRDLLILSLIGNGLLIFKNSGNLWSFNTILSNSLFSVGIGYPAWKSMGYLVYILDRKLPWLKYPLKRLVVQFLGLTFLAGIITFLGFTVWFLLIEELNFQALMHEIIPSLKVSYIFMILALVLANSVLFFKKWKEATIQQEELKRAHLALQYQTLKDQVRPHFLFNSLSSLATLINTDPEKATEFVHKLADVYRYVLDQRESELVPIQDELKFLDDYIYLQSIRFGDSLQVLINLDLDKNRMLIPLSLQMMVENAIKHNEISRDHPLLIDVTSTAKQEVLISHILQKIEVSEQTTGMGIENLRKRIAFFTDSPLIINESSGSFSVTIPTVLS